METLKIIKIGGNIINDSIVLNSFLEKFSKIKDPKVLVHGGGNIATNISSRMNIKAKMIQGRRITDSSTLDIVTMVYAGKINKTVVAKLQANNCNSIGFSGADGNTIVCEKRRVVDIDYGYVGDIKTVNTPVIKLLLKHKITPVFCAISHNKKGQLLNTNADTIASELAIALSTSFKAELYYCFDKCGVLKNVDDNDSVIQNINKKEFKSLLDAGIISKGMLPKLNNCFHALEHNVLKVCIGQPEMLFNLNSKFTTIQSK